MVIQIPDNLDKTFLDFLEGGIYFMTGLGTLSEKEISKDKLRLAKILFDILKNPPINQSSTRNKVCPCWDGQGCTFLFNEQTIKPLSRR